MGWVGDDNNINKANDILWAINIGVGERLNDQEIAAMIQAADEDGNGEISFPEFQKMMHW